MLLPRLLASVVISSVLIAAETTTVVSEPSPAVLACLAAAPLPTAAPGLLLQPGDRLAICGDSITEQRRYSRIIDTYLTACMPELRVSTRQYGWSGETAKGFLGRMESHCLRFKPTIATTCYGMNDYRYRPVDATVDAAYRTTYSAVIETFQKAGVRVVVGSPGCVGQVAKWVKTATGTLDEHNLHLATLRGIAQEVATTHEARFADLFQPMYTATFEARRRYGPAYAVSGHDGVHPEWAGATIMAYTFLTALGLDGNLGRITVDLEHGTATATGGHTVTAAANGEVALESTRYPFCTTGPEDRDVSLRSGMTLVPFDERLNRLTLVATGGKAARYAVTWGDQTQVVDAARLAVGINLAAEFPVNPFGPAFAAVDTAVAAKQAYETHQIRKEFQTPEAKADLAAVVARTEVEHDRLAQAVLAARVPVQHRIRIEPR